MLKAYSASPQFWRVAANEARRHTDRSTDPKERRVLSTIAEGYDWLAENASARLTEGVTRFSQQHQALGAEYGTSFRRNLYGGGELYLSPAFRPASAARRCGGYAGMVRTVHDRSLASRAPGGVATLDRCMAALTDRFWRALPKDNLGLKLLDHSRQPRARLNLISFA